MMLVGRNGNPIIPIGLEILLASTYHDKNVIFVTNEEFMKSHRVDTKNLVFLPRCS